MNSHNIIKITIIKLAAKYSSSFHFKVKICIKKTNEETETKESFKYEKTYTELKINKIIELPLSSPLTNDVIIQAFLQVYTKSGYKTAGAGEIPITDILNNSTDCEVEIVKCPLGKGFFHFKFDYNKPENKKEEKKNIINKTDKMKEVLSITEPKHNNINTNQSDSIKIENDKLKQKVEELEKELDKVKKNSPSSNSNNTNSTQLKDKEKIIQELKRKIEYFENENNDFKSIINDMKSEKKKITEEKNEMSRKQREKNTQLNEQIEKLQIENIQLNTLINTLQNEKENLNQQTQKQTTQLNEKTKKEVNDLIEKISSLSKAKVNLEKDLSDSQAKIEQLEGQLEQSKNKQKSQIDEMQKDLTDKQEELLIYQEKLRQKEEDNQKIKKLLEDKKEEIEDLNSKMQQMKIQSAESENGKLSELNALLVTKDSTIKELKIEKENLENQIILIQQNSSTSFEMNRSSDKKIKEDLLKMRKALDKKKIEINKLKQENEELKEVNLKYKNEAKNEESNQISNEVFLNHLQDMQKSFAEREEKIVQEKNEDIKRLKVENNNLKAELKKNSNNAEMTKCLNEIKRLTDQKNSIEEDLNYYKELNMKFIDTEKKATELEIENVKLRNMITEKNNENDTYKKEQIELSKAKAILENELIKSKEKIGELLNEIAEIENK